MVGAFSYATAIATPVFILASLNLRAAQATDAAGEHALGDYIALRTLTSVAALAGVGVFTLFCDARVAPLVALVALGKCLDSFSDLAYGVFQRYERLRSIAISMSLRGIASLLVVPATFAIAGGIVGVVLALCVVSLCTLVAYDVPVLLRMLRLELGRPAASASELLRPDWRSERWGRIARRTLPLGGALMLLSFNATIPRYFLEHERGQYELGIFASIAYLMLIGGMVSNAAIQSACPRLAQYHAARSHAAFVRLLGQLVLLALVLGAIGVLVSAVAGERLLILLYRREVAAHGRALTIVMFAASLSYVSGLAGTALTAMRYFGRQLPLHIATAGVTIVASTVLIPRHGIEGAAWTLVLGAGANAVLFSAAYLVVDRSTRGSTVTT